MSKEYWVETASGCSMVLTSSLEEPPVGQDWAAKDSTMLSHWLIATQGRCGLCQSTVHPTSFSLEGALSGTYQGHHTLNSLYENNECVCVSIHMTLYLRAQCSASELNIMP
jgi:hypothetical protein